MTDPLALLDTLETTVTDRSPAARLAFARLRQAIAAQRGRVTTLEGNFARISYDFTPAVRATMWQGILTAARLYLQAGAQEVFFSHQGVPSVRSLPELDKLADHGFRPILGPTISAHPQGTCRMGLDPRSSVVNPEFQVHGLPNLYVCDTSVFPTTSSTHTMTPTLTMAEFLGERITL